MKNFKKILTIILAVCMIVSVLTLTSCKKNKDKKEDETKNDEKTTQTTGKNYTVTVVNEDGAPLSGVKLILTDKKDYPNLVTDANGKASTQLAGDKIYVMVVTPASGYEKPTATIDNVYHGVFSKDSTELTITLPSKETNKVAYTVTVVDQYGNAVKNVGIQLCPGGVCLADDFTTDEYGEITAQIAPGKEVNVKLLSAPNGYSLPNAVDGYHGTIVAGETEIIIEIIKD